LKNIRKRTLLVISIEIILSLLLGTVAYGNGSCPGNGYILSLEEASETDSETTQIESSSEFYDRCSIDYYYKTLSTNSDRNLYNLMNDAYRDFYCGNITEEDYKRNEEIVRRAYGFSEYYEKRMIRVVENAFEQYISESIVDVSMAFFGDHPLCFFGGGCIYLEDVDLLYVSVNNEYAENYESFKQKKEAVEKMVLELTAEAETLPGELEKAVSVHDAICENVEYDYDDYNGLTTNTDCHTYFGYINGKKLVCDGYSELYKLAGIYAGLTVYRQEGVPKDVLEAHMWNVVRIEGKYYAVDLTWDDGKEYQPAVLYNYFGKGKSIYDDRIIDKSWISRQSDTHIIPELADEDLNYNNLPSDYGTEERGEFKISYCHTIPYNNGKYNFIFMNEGRLSISYNGHTYSGEVKVNSKKKKFQILNLYEMSEGASPVGSEINKKIRNLTKGPQGLPFEIVPYHVPIHYYEYPPSEDPVVAKKQKKFVPIVIKKKKDGDIRSIKLGTINFNNNYNGIKVKYYKPRKNEWKYDKEKRIITFSGSNLTGCYIVKE